MNPLGRDWGKQPPMNIEEGYQCAESIAQSACDELYRLVGDTMGGKPRVERREDEGKVIVIWPDGEISNELEVSHVN